MEYRCARCHTTFSVAEGEVVHACPQCKAEAGLEPAGKEMPLAMAIFSLVIGSAVLMTVVGGVLSVSGG